MVVSQVWNEIRITVVTHLNGGILSRLTTDPSEAILLFYVCVYLSIYLEMYTCLFKRWLIFSKVHMYNILKCSR